MAKVRSDPDNTNVEEYVPLSDIRGFTQMPALADLAGGADLPTTVAKVNALLAALRTAGLLAST